MRSSPRWSEDNLNSLASLKQSPYFRNVMEFQNIDNDYLLLMKRASSKPVALANCWWTRTLCCAS